MKKAISGRQVKRALFIDDYMYLVGMEEITVLNEADWAEVNNLKL